MAIKNNVQKMTYAGINNPLLSKTYMVVDEEGNGNAVPGFFLLRTARQLYRSDDVNDRMEGIAILNMLYLG
jgi:hypothetical protein